MNEQTNKLIEDLANKLGTTAEHLWQVLVRQAPIAASWGILELIIDAALVVFLWRMSWRLMIRGKRLDDDNEDEIKVFAAYAGGTIFGVAATVFTIGFLFGDVMGFQMVISGFLNPEYWALKQVIK